MLAGLQLDLDNIEWIAHADARGTADVASPEVGRHLKQGSWTLFYSKRSLSM
jgi:hypothetical protein